MRTSHRALLADARALPLGRGEVQLVVTSPPYPLIAMWDTSFAEGDPAVAVALAAGDGEAAFETMHRQLDAAWAEVARVLVPGGWLAVNVGDAVRTLGGRFRRWPNAARITMGAMACGLEPMPDILWRKPTNAPNKFMGSGTLPGGAYVTYEHEYVLLFRNAGERRYDPERRRESACFWEERNAWYSDLWAGLPGERQVRAGDRERSAAFPLELPWRLIQMYSLYGDTVLDPFGGTGTTGAAALAAGRSSVLVERDPSVVAGMGAAWASGLAWGGERVAARAAAHERFVAERRAAGKPPGHVNRPHGWPVVTRQEVELRLRRPVSVHQVAGGWEAELDDGGGSPSPT